MFRESNQSIEMQYGGYLTNKNSCRGGPVLNLQA